MYGSEDWPDRFFYRDYSAPGCGMYVIHYESQYYRLTTYAGGGFPIVYWMYELPFVVYGLVLARIAHRTFRGGCAPQTAVFATVLGIAFHLLGPEFDFPLLASTQFIGLGALTTETVVIGVVWNFARARHETVAE